MSSLGEWFDDFQENSEIINEAIKIADDRNNRSFGFVEYLLKEWSNNKLSTIEQVQTHERNKFQRPNQNSFRSKQSARNEKLPDWFEQKDNQKPVADPAVDEVDEARRKRLEAIQQKYKQGG